MLQHKWLTALLLCAIAGASSAHDHTVVPPDAGIDQPLSVTQFNDGEQTLPAADGVNAKLDFGTVVDGFDANYVSGTLEFPLGH